MIALLAALLQVTPADSIPTITLEEALRRSREIDPVYVAAAGAVDDAVWARRSAWSTFFIPTLTAQTSATEFSTEFFNIGTGQLASRIVDARLDASYDLFQGGRKFYELGRTGAELERARAQLVATGFDAALLTESAYYDVLAGQELLRVADERVRRAEGQLAIARARVVSGAAVQTDSLQVLLELTRARVDRLSRRAALRLARLQLGRRVGMAGSVDAAPLGPLPEAELPLTEEEAVREALNRGPDYRVAVGDERAAEAAVKAERGNYLPQVSLFAGWTGFDDSFFPSATTRTAYGLQVTLPIWNGGQRELALAQARTRRDVARAARRDVELALRRDVVGAYENYRTARASVELATEAVLVARENLRVQESRYRVGATTILDLLTAQFAQAEAEAQLVQAGQATRLALAELEALIGRRLHVDEESVR